MASPRASPGSTGSHSAASSTEKRPAWPGASRLALQCEVLPLDELYPLWRASCMRKLERWDAAETGIMELLEPNPGNALYRLEAARHSSWLTPWS